MTIESGEHYQEQIKALLQAEKLLIADLKETCHFLVALVDTIVVGVAGMEIYADYGLLRSVAVKPGYRDRGIGGGLVNSIELLGSSKGLSELYLLTETASEYFRGKGFAVVDRRHVPAVIQSSTEFAHICPSSAIVMNKVL